MSARLTEAENVRAGHFSTRGGGERLRLAFDVFLARGISEMFTFCANTHNK